MNFTPAERKEVNRAAAHAMYNALCVIAEAPRIKEALAKIDPQALAQVERAIQTGERLLRS